MKKRKKYAHQNNLERAITNYIFWHREYKKRSNYTGDLTKPMQLLLAEKELLRHDINPIYKQVIKLQDNGTKEKA